MRMAMATKSIYFLISVLLRDQVASHTVVVVVVIVCGKEDNATT